MHPRYRHHQMEHVWSNQQQYKRWHEVEFAVALAGAMAKVAPAGLPDSIRNVKIDDAFVAACLTREQETRHDVAAFVEILEQRVRPADEARFVHFGATSSDIVDTALVLAVRAANAVLDEELDRLQAMLVDARRRWGQTLRIGRTHGRVAGTVLVDQMVSVFLSDLWTIQADLSGSEFYGKLGGPLGDFPIVPFSYAARAFRKALGVEVAQFTTQVVSRDGLVRWCQILERAAFLVEKVATWIRFESIEGVDQLRRLVPAEEVGSSSMPHKVNPAVAENLCGLSRMVRSNLRAVTDSSVLWADRDLSHSSVERVALPDACVLLAHSLGKLADLLGTLEPIPARTPTAVPSFDQLHLMIRDGMSRTEAHAKLRGLR